MERMEVRDQVKGQRQVSKPSPASWRFKLVDLALGKLKQERWLVRDHPELHDKNLLREKKRKEKQKENRKN